MKVLSSTSVELLKAFFNGGNAQGMNSGVIKDLIATLCEIEEKHGKEVDSRGNFRD